MTTDLKDKAEVEKRLWSEIEHARFGMLGPVGCEVVQHFQPMTAFAEPESGKIWFFTNSETDLARAAAPCRCQTQTARPPPAGGLVHRGLKPFQNKLTLRFSINLIN